MSSTLPKAIQTPVRGGETFQFPPVPHIDFRNSFWHRTSHWVSQETMMQKVPKNRTQFLILPDCFTTTITANSHVLLFPAESICFAIAFDVKGHTFVKIRQIRWWWVRIGLHATCCCACRVGCIIFSTWWPRLEELE